MGVEGLSVQRDYYKATAHQYDDMHFRQRDEHQFALAFMRGLITLFDVKSVLDIGSGTGRVLMTLAAEFPHVRFVGIEPSADLRNIGYQKGLKAEQLMDGDAQALALEDESFDFVCEFATLHHIPDPGKAVSEMLRVARLGVFISDSNCYGQGSSAARFVKRLIRRLGLWPAFNLVRTGGKNYMWSEGDGLFYSYSVWDSLKAIRRACASVHVLNTTGKVTSPLHDASHVAVVGLKQELLSLS